MITQKQKPGSRITVLRRSLKASPAAQIIIAICLIAGISALTVALIPWQSSAFTDEPDDADYTAVTPAQVLPGTAFTYHGNSLVTERIHSTNTGLSSKTHDDSQTPAGAGTAAKTSVRFIKLEDAVKPVPPENTAADDEPLPYLIYVSKNSHTIAILGLDEAGEYTQILHTFPTATGRTNSMTRTGTFSITTKERWHHWGGGNSYSPYTTRYDGGAFFHGPIFYAKNPRTLIVKSFNDIGTNATSGCMRTTTEAALWIYENCGKGTQVIIANDSVYTVPRPAPLPGTQKSDPTDPDG